MDFVHWMEHELSNRPGRHVPGCPENVGDELQVRGSLWILSELLKVRMGGPGIDILFRLRQTGSIFWCWRVPGYNGMRPSSLSSLSIRLVEELLLSKRESPFWKKELQGTDLVSLSLLWDGRNRLASELGIGGCNSLATSGPLPPLWPVRGGASEQRVEGRLLCCCWVTPAGSGGGMEGRRLRQLRYLLKLSSLFRNVGENLVSKFLWSEQASPQLEADRSYLRPWPLPPPRPLLLKGRADEGPLESLSCRLCPWSLESFRLEEDEALGRSLLKFWDRCWFPDRAL